ncbi:MAG TPA: transcriptional regulator [Woeseiaceae bacterium]|nr:transcriptional regulator [Woeseiaceae bacterium]
MSEFDHNRLDDLIHSRIRLAVMAVLAGVERAEFTFIRDRVNTSDGNLSTHLRKLEDSGYVRIRKRFQGRKPVTDVAMTPKGREAFSAYIAHLERLLRPPEG